MGCGASSHPPEGDPKPAAEAPAPAPAPAASPPPPVAPEIDPVPAEPIVADEPRLGGEMPFATNEEASFQCIDMDAPRSSSSFASQPTSPLFPGNTTKVKLGAQSKKRFRKRSVNLSPLPEDHLLLVRQSFDRADTESTGFITQEALKNVLKDNYKPSEIETMSVLQWFDTCGNGTVEFQEYVMAMASVMTQAGIEADAGIEKAREALSYEIQRMSSTLKKEEPVKFNMDNLAHAYEIVGAQNIEKMKERWDGLDVEKQGFLNKDGIKELIRLTYVPSTHTMDAFVRVFTFTEKGISRADFEQGMTLLYGDFSYAMPGRNQHSSIRMQ